MKEYQLSFVLRSDATFGRGEGIAGLIDREVEHDSYGLPYLRGRTLKGLLSEEVDNLLFALGGGNDLAPDRRWLEARQALFGRPGSREQDRAIVHYGPAELPEALRATIRLTLEQHKDDLSRTDILELLTTVRRQTAIEADGAPAEGSLRAMRVILRNTPFSARLTAQRKLHDDELALLAAGILAFRRAGTGRNRGRGRLEADLLEQESSGAWQSKLWSRYDYFAQEALT